MKYNFHYLINEIRFFFIYIYKDLLNRTYNKQPLPWYKTLKYYYQRPEWELYNLKYDPEERNNIFSKPSMKVKQIQVYYLYY